MTILPRLFWHRLAEEFLAEDGDERWDELRFPGHVGAEHLGQPVSSLSYILEHLPEYGEAWTLYEDDRSKDLFVRLLAYRARGPGHVSLPLDVEQYWKEHEAVSAIDSLAELVNAETGFGLGVYDLRPFGFDLSARCHLLNVLDTFALRQYEIHRPEMSVVARPGDVVIDGGAAWGDTALYFADRVGDAGRVVALEFVEESVEIFRENLVRNPELARVIELDEHALWGTSGTNLSYSMAGPGTSVAADSGNRHVETISIDDLIAARGLTRVDFVKLDVEGSELETLKGAIETLRRWRPQLALSAYHRPEDLEALPRWLDGLGLGYRFCLEHFTSHLEESVLFAAA